MAEPDVGPPAASVTGATPRPATPPGALARHRAWQDAEALAWPAANEAVRQAGGWRAYAREAQGDAADPGRPAAAPVAPR